MNIKTKLIAVSSALAIVPLITATLIIESMAINTASEALEDAAKNQLISIRDTKKAQIEDYFATIRNQVITQSGNRMTINAMRELNTSYEFSADGADINSMRSELAAYYTNQFGPEYSKLNSGKSADVMSLLNKLDDNGVALQYHYIQANTNSLGNKHKLDAAPGEAPYNRIHAQYHPAFRQFLEAFEYYDVFLVNNDGNVVYSVYKELDYATNLKNGAYASSGIANAFNKASSLSRGDVAFVDFAPYTPSYEGAASFIASPIFENGERTGVLIFQMPIGKINAIMTSNEKWKDIGLGASGETYLVGPDMKARSMSRFLIEDKAGFIALMKDVGTSDSDISAMTDKETNIGIQTLDTQGTKAAVAGKTGYEIFPDYRGVNVLSAYTPIDVNGVQYGLMSEIDEEEAFAAADTMASDY